MTYWFEEAAYNNLPAPEGMTSNEMCIYSFLRNLYWSYRNKLISKEQAQKEKDVVLKKYEKEWASREFERRCWENSARRTMAAERGMTMYKENRTLENADNLYGLLEWLHDECTVPTIKTENGANCPICNKFFDHAHAERKPTYCENCGCHLGWEN